MVAVALNNVALMLTLYVAVLVWTMQLVADRYSTKVIINYLRTVALWPFLILISLLIGVGLLSLHTNWGVASVCAFLCLLCTIGATVFGVFLLVRALADGTTIINTVDIGPDGASILQEVILRGAARSDTHVTTAAIRALLQCTSDNGEGVLNWLTDHRELIGTSWMTQVVVDQLVAYDASPELATMHCDLLSFLINGALDSGAMARARMVTDSVTDMLVRVPRWTEAHSNLLFAVYFSLLRIGEPEGSKPRKTAVPFQLLNLQARYTMRMLDILENVLASKNSEAIGTFSEALGKLAFETADDPLHNDFFVCAIFDLLEGAIPQKVLTSAAILNLAQYLGWTKHAYPRKDPDTPTSDHSEIDRLVIYLAGALIELEADDYSIAKVLKTGGVYEVTDTARFEGGTVYVPYHKFLQPDTLTAVAKHCGLEEFAQHRDALNNGRHTS